MTMYNNVIVSISINIVVIVISIIVIVVVVMLYSLCCMPEIFLTCVCSLECWCLSITCKWQRLLTMVHLFCPSLLSLGL